jgi:hypothetical protein
MQFVYIPRGFDFNSNYIFTLNRLQLILLFANMPLVHIRNYNIDHRNTF